jgi:hypothetical protein
MIHFDPILFDRAEMLTEPEVFEYVDVCSRRCKLSIPSGGFVFTVCQVPVIYRSAIRQQISIVLADGSVRHGPDSRLTREETNSLISRDGKIEKIVFEFDPEQIRENP